MRSCSPGTQGICTPVSPNTLSASSNSVGLERCVISPVWMMNDGLTGIAFTLATASRSVPSASGFGGLRGADQFHRVRHAAADGPEPPGPRPDHAFQHLPAAQSLSTILKTF